MTGGGVAPFERVLVTGGAGFVGATLCLRLAQAGFRVTALDNLLRRGSELNLPRLRAAGVEFVHGDLRAPEDLERAPAFDLLIDCAAEPSVHAGASGSPRCVLQNNLVGTLNCLEECRRRGAGVLFLSTSRVYPIEPLNAAPYRVAGSRFEWTSGGVGLSPDGLDESFPLSGARSFYGASKLACEVVATEYHATYGVPTLINRCGVLAGPWQMGKVDQGFVALWVSRHVYGKPLKYLGWGGEGHQVRDLLHVEDLADLVLAQLARPETFDARVYNVGGGRAVSTSLAELTALCQELTGRAVPVGRDPDTTPLDVRIYLTDAKKVQAEYGWAPRRSVRTIAEDTTTWLQDHLEVLRPFLG